MSVDLEAVLAVLGARELLRRIVNHREGGVFDWLARFRDAEGGRQVATLEDGQYGSATAAISHQRSLEP
jgi:hypothetical protein